VGTRIGSVAVLVTSAVGLGLFAPVGAPASCAGPVLSFQGVSANETSPSIPEIHRGQPVNIRGSFFFDGCNDAGSQGPGCSKRKNVAQVPARDVELVLSQGGKSWSLATADAAEGSYEIVWNIMLPAEVRPGSATFTARTAQLVVSVAE
jgi:hypothetical protein